MYCIIIWQRFSCVKTLWSVKEKTRIDDFFCCPSHTQLKYNSNIFSVRLFVKSRLAVVLCLTSFPFFLIFGPSQSIITAANQKQTTYTTIVTYRIINHAWLKRLLAEWRRRRGQGYRTDDETEVVGGGTL